MSLPASTRALYEKKLRKLLQPDGHDHLNGAEKGVLYSDSEEEEGNGEEEDEESGMTRGVVDLIVWIFCFYGWCQIIVCFVLFCVTGSEGAKEETVEQSDQAQQDSSQVRTLWQLPDIFC